MNDYAFSSNHISSYYVNYNKDKKLKLNNNDKKLLLNNNDKKLLFDIKKQYKFFDFCTRYVYNDLQIHMKQLQNLINMNYIIPEKSFIIKNDDIVSHFEHNVYVNEHKNIFLTKNKYY